jgi:ArsR family metal-binding transcriptional regulator
MYLDSIALTCTLPCLAEPGQIIVIGKPNRLLGEVLPYLATLPGITPALEPQAVWCGASVAYNPGAHTLTFRRPAGFMTLYTDRVYLTQVRDTDAGLGLLAALMASFNAAWDHRQQLVAVTLARRAPRPLDVWTLLLQTNCRKCGEATCMAFAVGLLQHKRSVIECRPLHANDALTVRRATLEAML